MAGTAAQSPAESRDSRLRQDETFLRRAFHRSLLPCVLSILSENINILADGVLVGQRIGTDGLSAISLCVPVYLVLCVVGSFLVSGTAIQATRAIGRQQPERSQRLYRTAVWSCLAASLVMTAAGLALSGPLSALLCPDPAIRPLVREYASITLLGALPKILIYVPFWFLRMDGVTHYGCDPVYERICTEPKEPLCFFNMEGHPGATLLIWEHTLDSNGKPCSNPRAIVPRWDVPNIVKEPVEVDVRSFGVRMPPSTRDNPNYGIMGMLHIIPPALAWLWRLIAPRGFNNPSIVTGNELKSEGVGSYWPFATGKRVKQANLLLHQIVDSPNTRYVLIPNQHIGVYKVGFAAEWISREYLARHGGAKIRREHLEPARCPLLGYAMKDLTIDGQKIRSKFLRVDTQDRVGTDGYDAGAKILTDFFRKELAKFDTPELEPLGKQIIDCFMNGGTLEDFEKITPTGL